MSKVLLTPALRTQLEFAGPGTPPDLHALDAYLKAKYAENKPEAWQLRPELEWTGTGGNMMIYSFNCIHAVRGQYYTEACIQMSHNDDGQVIRVMAEYSWNTEEKDERKDTFHSEGAGWFWVEELLQFAAEAMGE